VIKYEKFIEWTQQKMQNLLSAINKFVIKKVQAT